jgi:hypothetical protein
MLSLFGLYYLIGLSFQLFLLFNANYVSGWKEASPGLDLSSAFVASLAMALIWPKHVFMLLRAILH